MKLLRLKLVLLISICLGAALPAFPQSMSNTDNVLTLTNTCINAGVTNGAYTLELQYYDNDAFTTKTLTVGVTVAVSSGVMTITAPSGSFPSPSSNGWWSLPDAWPGHIKLTSGSFITFMDFYQNPDGSIGFTCTPLPVWFSSFTVTGGSFQATLNWTTDLEQSTTYIEIYRSSSGNTYSYYKIGQVTAQGNSNIPHNYSFVDPHPCTTNYYYLKMLNNQGTPPIFSDLTHFLCSGCTCSLPSPVNCNFTINGPDHICNVETPTAYTLSSAVPNYSTISWSVDVPSAARLQTYPNFDDTKVTLLKKTSDAGVTLKATLSGCTNVITKYVVMGIPPPYISSTEVCPDVYVYAGNHPNATSYDWHFTDETNGYSWVLTNYVPGWNGTLTVGDVYDIGFVYNNVCGTSASADLYGVSCEPWEGFMIAPNPSRGMVTIDLAATVQPAVKPATIAATGSAVVPKDVAKRPAMPRGVYKVRVVDALGVVRKEFSYHGESRVTLDLSGLTKGMYTVQIFDNKIWKSGKVVLVK